MILYYDKFDCSYSFQSSQSRFIVHVIIMFYYLAVYLAIDWKELAMFVIDQDLFMYFSIRRMCFYVLCHHLFLPFHFYNTIDR